MHSRMRYLIPLILAAAIPLSGLAATSVPAQAGSARYALSFGKKKNKKQHKTPKSKRSHGAKKQKRTKSAR